MKFKNTTLQDVYVIKPAIFHDGRGHYFDSVNLSSWEKQDFINQFVQDNQSFSTKGVVRGLHFRMRQHA